MSTYIKVTPKAEALGSSSSTTHSEYEVELVEVEGGARYVPMDGGATFIAAVVYVIGEFAKGLGEGLGKELGKAIGKALFGSGASKEEIKNLLNFFTQYILAEVRREFQKDRWDRAHEQLAVASMAFNDALVDPSQRTKDNLLSINREIFDGYVKLQNLGLGAFASQARMGVAMIGCALLYAETTKQKESYQIALQRVDTVMGDLQRSFDELAKAKDGRVIGPYEAIGRDMCYEPGFEASPYVSAPSRTPGHWYEIKVPVYDVSIDGTVSSFARLPNPCKSKEDRSAEAYAHAKAMADSARAINDRDFADKFGFPFDAVKAKAEELRRKIGKKV